MCATRVQCLRGQRSVLAPGVLELELWADSWVLGTYPNPLQEQQPLQP